MINRAAVILKYKAPAIKWVNDADPMDRDFTITEELINSDRTVYLISEADAFDDRAVQDWIERNYMELFDTELEGWYTDLKLWPKSKTLKLFYEWFKVECHTVLIDTADDGIYDDEV